MALKLYPSLIDSIEYYLLTEFDDPDREQESLTELIAQIRRDPRADTDPQLRGRAFHKLVECGAQANPKRGVRLETVVTKGGVPLDLFDVGLYATAPDGSEYLAKRQFIAQDIREFMAHVPPGGVSELKLEDFSVGPVRMTVKCDYLLGADVWELKSKERALEDKHYNAYMDSIQWRIYCMAYGVRRVNYLVAQLGTDRKTGAFTVNEVHRFTLTAYPRMQQDVEARVARAVGFIRDRGLIEFITVPDEPAERAAA